ncbi:MAG: protein kinase domain-containing protein, partial [Thermoanaerobaculia bacterium]
LKPGNVMITKSGVKLLDFGLAKAIAPMAAQSGATSLPTMAGTAQNLTEAGTILGTFQYMAPEQLEGKEADARTDIFAFGAVVYEMATGRKAFSGTSQASLISAIMKEDPTPVSTVAPMTPPALDRVVRKCLAKDPEDRWQSAADLGSELKWIGEGSQAGVAAPTTVRRRNRERLAWAALSLLLAAGLALRVGRSGPALSGRLEFSIVPPHTSLTDFLSVSADGRNLAFVGVADGKALIRLREMGSDEVRSLPGTDGAELPFWSADGRSLGFFQFGKLKTIDLGSGSVQVLCNAELGRGGTWNREGVILFAAKSVGSLYRVPASGGKPALVTAVEASRGEVLHRWPQFLPDGRRFIFFVKTEIPETTGVYLGSLDSPRPRLLQRAVSGAFFVAPDSLLFVRGETLFTQRVDLSKEAAVGDPEAVARPVARADYAAFLHIFAASESGVVVFRPGGAEKQLAWFDRLGTPRGAVGPKGDLTAVSLSPDGRTVSFSRREAETDVARIWVLDLARDLLSPFTKARGEANYPMWTPDGGSILYRFAEKNLEIRRTPFRGGEKEETLFASSNFPTPTDVSPDGRWLLFTRSLQAGDIWLLPLSGERKAVEVLTTEADERLPRFAPDGRWFAYLSNESGQFEIYVRRFPVTEEKWRVSAAGGQQPRWSRDGREIVYVSLDGTLMAAPVTAAAGFSVGPPTALFQTSMRLFSYGQQYAMTADGQRFLIIVPTREIDTGIFRVVMNWRRAEGSR